MTRSPIAAATACFLACIALAVGQTTTHGQEPNNTKAEATLAPNLQVGDSIAARTCSGTGLNFFRVSTAPAPAGIYRHSLEDYDFGYASLRLFGEDAVTDAVLPGSLALLADPLP